MLSFQLEVNNNLLMSFPSSQRRCLQSQMKEMVEKVTGRYRMADTVPLQIVSFSCFCNKSLFKSNKRLFV